MAKHRMLEQIMVRPYVLAFDFSSARSGWWRLRWPGGKANHERFVQ